MLPQPTEEVSEAINMRNSNRRLGFFSNGQWFMNSETTEWKLT